MSTFRLVAIVLTCILFATCKQRSKSLSFYYWRTGFQLNSLERKTLQDNAVQTLYVRYFDVDVQPGETEPEPVSPVTTDTSMQRYKIVPVVFIKNRTFERLDSAATVTLANNIHKLVNRINRQGNINNTEIQFDCDWTAKTKNAYFLFLRSYRALSKKIISSTIRLHQVKYPGLTGIPPVEYGTLMYYNMGAINAGSRQSIFDPSIANRYNSYIRSYPLTLDIAMPVFSWAQKIQDGKVVQLLNKIYFSHFENDSNFIVVKPNRYLVKHACFKAGYYFSEKDEVKIEAVSAGNLFEITDQVNRYSNGKIRNLIFFDLDSTNIVQYEKTIFKKILGHLH